MAKKNSKAGAASRKKGVKKTPAKKKLSGNFLSKVHDDKRFFCADGKIFASLTELDKAMNSLRPEIFNHHVNSGKNDFSNWISEVIGDKKLAENLRNSTDQKDIAKKIKTRIGYLKRNKS